jgi:tetratricopeptide (TPR) repeat protein
MDNEMVRALHQREANGPTAVVPPAARPQALRTLATARLRAFLLTPVVAAVACTSWRGNPDSVGVRPEDLLAGTALGVAAHASAAVVAEQDVLAVSPGMARFLDRYVDRRGSDDVKLRQLVDAVIDTKTFGVQYDTTTRTASETFREGRGNCLSFSNMFVAMAREAGLKVEYQEVDVPPDWSLDKDTYVLNQHVNVRVDLEMGRKRVVDFNIGDFRSSYEMRTIPDTRALAHYYNNIGVECMQAGDMAGALLCFRRAIADYDRKFSAAWTNLGTLHMRNGHPAQAEAAYLQALKADKGDLVAMSNLARLYDRIGDRKLAAAYRKRVIHHRWLNPYYRYDLACRAYDAQEYDAAIGHLTFAVRERPNEELFYVLLGSAYLEKGNARAARRWFERMLSAADASKRQRPPRMESLVHRGY